MNDAARNSASLTPAGEPIAAVEAALLDYAEKRDSGTVPILPLPQRRAQALRFVQTVGTWVDGCYVSVHHKFDIPGKSESAIPGSAHQSAESAVDEALYWADKRATDVYLAMGAQQDAKAVEGRRYPKAIRKRENTVAASVLYLDIDVKDEAHRSAEEAARALIAFVQASAWPPSLIIGSGGGGFHAYWRSGRLMTPAQFKARAAALVQAAQKHGLHFDPQCTTNICQLLRLPGSWNFKRPEQPRPVLLIHADDDGGS
jgi:hypothetical protein